MKGGQGQKASLTSLKHTHTEEGGRGGLDNGRWAGGWCGRVTASIHISKDKFYKRFQSQEQVQGHQTSKSILCHE